MPRTIHYHHHARTSDAVSFDLHTHGPFDGLLLGGGVDVDPTHYRSGVDTCPSNFRRRQRDDFELNLIRQSFTAGRPILGICRGCQLLNVALGGSLRILGRNHLHRHVTRCWKHPVSIRRGSRLHQILEMRRLTEVRSIHHEVVDKPGTGVSIVAKAPDGVPEAIEAVHHDIGSSFCIGVQWHPELIMWQNSDQPLIDAFIDAARQFQRSRS